MTRTSRLFRTAGGYLFYFFKKWQTRPNIRRSKLLIKIINGVIENPNVEKYRRLKVSGKAFTEKLMPVDGAVPFLYELGFGESSDGEFIEVKERGDISSIFDPRFSQRSMYNETGNFYIKLFVD